MKKAVTLGPILMVMMGCVSVDNVPLPHQQEGYVIECSGAFNAWSDCYAKAQALCPNGYELLDRDGQSEVVSVNDSFMKLTERRLVVSCL